MKRLGLLGTFLESTSGSYLSTLNAEIQKEYGGSAEVSVNLQTLQLPLVESLLATEDWDGLLTLSLRVARAFLCNPVDGIVVCGSRLQPLAPEIRSAVKLPVLDMGYSLSSRLQSFSIQRVALLGAYTPKEEAMWSKALAPKRVILPSAADTNQLRDILRQSFQLGQPIPPTFRFEAMRIVASLRREGAQALLLAAPQLAPIFRTEDTMLTVFDTAEIHASVAGMWAAHREVGITPPCCLPAA